MPSTSTVIRAATASKRTKEPKTSKSFFHKLVTYVSTRAYTRLDLRVRMCSHTFKKIKTYPNMHVHFTNTAPTAMRPLLAPAFPCTAFKHKDMHAHLRDYRHDAHTDR